MKVIFNVVFILLLICSFAFAQDIQVTRVVENYAAINKGSHDGIKTGQVFNAKRFIRNQWQFICIVRIVQVRSDVAAIESENKNARLQVGDILFRQEDSVGGDLLNPRQGTQNQTRNLAQGSSKKLSSVGIRKMMISPFVGMSKPTGDSGEYWKFGFQGGGSIFINAIPNFAFGGWVAFNRWLPDKDKFTGGASMPGVSVDVSGGASIIELIPAGRFLIPISPDKSKLFFLNAGFGLYILKFDITTTTTYSGMTSTYKMDDSKTKPGLAIGGGIILARARGIGIQVMSVYHIIFTEGSSTKYITAGIGIIL